MRQIKGCNGRVYSVGEPYDFEGVPLHDCGDGWDWRAPDGLFYWLPDSVSFDVSDADVGAVELHHRSGRVGFGRCAAGMDVRASGTCLPTSLLGEGDQWFLRVSAFVRDATSFGSESVETKTRLGDATAEIRGVELDPIEEDVVVWLPTSGEGVFVGIGRAKVTPGVVEVTISKEGVTYGYR